jgi:hypothetical protein
MNNYFFINLPLRQGDAVVDNRAGGRVAAVGKDPGVDPLGHDEEGHAPSVRAVHLSQLFLDHGDLVLTHVRDLSITDAVTVDDDPGGKVLVIGVLVLAQRLHQIQANLVAQLLTSLVGSHDGEKATDAVVQRGHQAAVREAFVHCVVTHVKAHEHGALHWHFNRPRRTTHLEINKQCPD